MYRKFNVIDSHCHIYPDKIAERAVNGTDTFYGMESLCKGTVSDLIERGKNAGVDHFIVQSVATTEHQVRSINEFIAKSVQEHKGTLTGLGTLHPDSMDQASDVEHLISLGLQGVKLHPDIQQFAIDDERCLKIYELCQKYSLPILMHTGDYRYDYSNPNRVMPVLQKFPDITMIGAHFGGWSVWQEAAQKLCKCKNFYVDCSSSFYALTPQETKDIIHAYGVDKVLFGTDYPMWEPRVELEYLHSLGLSDEENKMILSENAKKLFDIKI